MGSSLGLGRSAISFVIPDDMQHDKSKKTTAKLTAESRGIDYLSRSHIESTNKLACGRSIDKRVQPLPRVFNSTCRFIRAHLRVSSLLYNLLQLNDRRITLYYSPQGLFPRKERCNPIWKITLSIKFEIYLAQKLDQLEVSRTKREREREMREEIIKTWHADGRSSYEPFLFLPRKIGWNSNRNLVKRKTTSLRYTRTKKQTKDGDFYIIP